MPSIAEAGGWVFHAVSGGRLQAMMDADEFRAFVEAETGMNWEDLMKLPVLDWCWTCEAWHEADKHVEAKDSEAS